MRKFKEFWVKDVCTDTGEEIMVPVSPKFCISIVDDDIFCRTAISSQFEENGYRASMMRNSS